MYQSDVQGVIDQSSGTGNEAVGVEMVWIVGSFVRSPLLNLSTNI